MSIFQNPILVTLSATESFISLCTFSRKFGRSQTFYLMKNNVLPMSRTIEFSTIVQS